MRNKFRKVAFTLAEVLIVLSIIGIIADMTIPTLVANVQKETTVTMLKKAYSEISQAMKMAEAENGMMDGWTIDDTSLTTNQNFTDTYFYPYVKTLKKCGSTETGCWTPTVSLSKFPSPYARPGYNKALSAITASGYSILIYVPSQNGVYFFIDVDGPNKGKNKFGKDVFHLILNTKGSSSKKQGVYPVGLERIPLITDTELTSDSSGCSKDRSGSWAGSLCAAFIARDGWKISDTYPWN